MQSVFIKSQDEQKAVVAGWGVVFDGSDLEGESFNTKTDFMLDLVPSKLVLYDHGLNKTIKNVFLGYAKANTRDKGVWVEAELLKNQNYIDEVLLLIEKGALGWSSGSVGHLVEKEGTWIKRWPIVEFSLTPTPAEPRTLGVERIKSLAKEFPNLKALLESEQTTELNAMELETNADKYLQLRAEALLLTME
jgi:phage head maturation protease